MPKLTAKTCLALMLLSAAGCSAIQDHCISLETRARNCVLAEKGWVTWASCYEDVEYKLHFAKGFKEGYTNILEGGSGCQPTLPPRWYWKPCYQTPEGRCKIAAWFDGYSHGAVAAQQDGFGNLQQIPISPTARANLLTRQAPASAECFAGSDSTAHQPSSNDAYPDAPTTDRTGDRGGDAESTLLIPPGVDEAPVKNPMPPVRPYDEPAPGDF